VERVRRQGPEPEAGFADRALEIVDPVRPRPDRGPAGALRFEGDRGLALRLAVNIG
jgi:hypothetical protein